jgi:solute:Na+ symporter, SSS family
MRGEPQGLEGDARCYWRQRWPLLGHFDQAFQFVQEYLGFFTPGITVIFLLGLFWKRANETGALVAAVGSALLSFLYWKYLPGVPFMNRIGYVFLICLGMAIAASLSQKPKPKNFDNRRFQCRLFHERSLQHL